MISDSDPKAEPATSPREPLQAAPKTLPSTHKSPQTPIPSTPFTQSVTTTTLLTLPQTSPIILIHATNCLGEWGSGFALALRTLYPNAYRIYRDHCGSTTKPGELAGTCLLIPPAENDGRKVWIANLFTSVGFGRRTEMKPGRDGRRLIICQTREALGGLKRQIRELLGRDSDGGRGDGDWKGIVGEDGRVQVYSPMFNSGSFGIEWDVTRRQIGEEFEGMSAEIEWTILAAPEKKRKHSRRDDLIAEG